MGTKFHAPRDPLKREMIRKPRKRRAHSPVRVVSIVKRLAFPAGVTFPESRGPGLFDRPNAALQWCLARVTATERRTALDLSWAFLGIVKFARLFY